MHCPFLSTLFLNVYINCVHSGMQSQNSKLRHWRAAAELWLWKKGCVVLGPHFPKSRIQALNHLGWGLRCVNYSEDHHSEESGVLKTNQWHEYIWILLQDHIDDWVATKLAEHKSLNPQWSDGTLRLQRRLQCLYVNNTLQICCTTDSEWYCVK